MTGEHGLLLYLPAELSMGLIKYQAAHEVGRSFAGLSLVNEALFRNNCISQEVYERFQKRYSVPLIPVAAPKVLTTHEQQEKAKIVELEKQFSGALKQWDTLSMNAKAKHVINARNYVGIVPNAKMILDLEDPLQAKERELKGDPGQKFGEGKAIEQFANAIHSNPETVKPEPVKCVACGKVDESNPYRIWCPKGGGERSKNDVCIVETT